jgi:N-acyl-D-amino-acid deacylase
MDSADVRVLMRQPWTMTSSDGGLVPMDEGVPHPRNYGTFPRKIRKYALDEGIVSLEGAIRSMTSLPASVFRMKDRGQIREGSIADIVVFDPDTIRDRAEYERPHQLSEGMRYVFVNGTLAIDNGDFTTSLNGRVLSRSQR